MAASMDELRLVKALNYLDECMRQESEGNPPTVKLAYLHDVLSRAREQYRKLYATNQAYAEAEKYYKSTPKVPRYREQIRQLAYKIRRQKMMIHTLQGQVRRLAGTNLMLTSYTDRLRNTRKPIEALFGEVYRAAEKNNLIRVLALLEDFKHEHK